MLGSYSWGTVIVTFFAGVFAEKYGPRKVAGYAIASGAILSALAPVSANFLWLSIMVRLFTGIAMVAKYFIKTEKTFQFEPELTGCNFSIHSSGNCKLGADRRKGKIFGCYNVKWIRNPN